VARAGNDATTFADQPVKTEAYRASHRIQTVGEMRAPRVRIAQDEDRRNGNFCIVGLAGLA